MNSPHNADHPDVIAWPPLLFIGCVVVGGLLHFVFRLRIMTTYWASLSIGVVCVVVSAAMAIWAERTMKAAGTNVRPDQPALTIVRSGPYRFTRNPMYLSLCLFQIGVGFLFDGWVPLLFTIPLMLILHFGVILREERYLEAKFGEPYLTLKREVRRLI